MERGDVRLMAGYQSDLIIEWWQYLSLLLIVLAWWPWQPISSEKRAVQRSIPLHYGVDRIKIRIIYYADFAPPKLVEFSESLR